MCVLHVSFVSNVTCCPHPFSVLNCHVWNRCIIKAPLPSCGFGGVWEQVVVVCLKTLQELRNAVNCMSPYRDRSWCKVSS